MKTITRLFLLLLALINGRLLTAQDAEYDSLLAVYLKLDSIWLAEIETDSLDIFSLLDIISTEKKSQLVARTTYNSQVFNAGRSYEINSSYLTGGMTYYHKSGLYADVSGQYYSEISPHYNATSTSIGYSNFFTSKWSYNVNMSHAFYHELEETSSFNNSLTNSLGLGSFYYAKYFTFGLDYIYSFGLEDVSAHRLVPSVTFVTKMKAKGFLSNFKFNPLLYLTFGTETIYTEQNKNLLARNIIHKMGANTFSQKLRNKDEELLSLTTNTDTINYFGILNVQLTFPIQYKYRNFTTILSYNINSPIATPGEVLQEKFSDYFGLSVYYSFNSK